MYIFLVGEIKSNSRFLGTGSNWLHPNVKLRLEVQLKD